MRLKQWLSAAAEDVTENQTDVNTARRNAAATISPPMTRTEARELLRTLGADLITFFMAFRSPVTVPAAFHHSTAGYRMLGERAGRTLTVGPYRYLADMSAPGDPGSKSMAPR